MRDSEVLPWLKALPLAPEYHPTEAEFADPIAYILKIEREASQYGICKIIPPLPKSPKKVVIANLNRCLAKSQNTTAGAPPNVHGSSCSTINNSNSVPCPHQTKDTNVAKFSTRQQQIGWSPKRSRGGGPMQSIVHKSVWQSGETYTLDQFEAKAKLFSRSRLKTCKELAPLIVETLFWKATADKPMSVEYANDIPGTAFEAPNQLLSSCPKNRKTDERKLKQEGGCEALALDSSGVNGFKLSNTAWNMRIASRSHGSLLRYMPDEVPGVTSPMVYIAMLFSWFAWHVEDHDLHSLNYLHMGAPKTWYGVPGDAAFAFEEVVGCHGYGDQVNPLVTFAMLGEKTTVMSPEILVAAGVPCCRLVQNAGEFVVTFPRAYHLGFSHGFNCGEAANLATPEWLKVAKEAAVRRAAMNYLPMLSHQQLLYILALAFHSRIPMSLATEPRSSRLKDRKRGEGETIVKKFFVNDVIENNHLLSILLKKGSSCSAVLWNSANFSCGFPSSPLCFSTMCNTKSSTAFRVNSLEVSTLPSVTAVNNSMPECLNKGMRTESFSKIKKESISVSTGFDFVLVDNFQREKQISSNHGIFSDDDNARGGPSFNRDMPFDDMHLDSGPLACVACGVLGFASMAVIQPCEKAARILLPANHKICHTYCGTSGTGTVRYDTASDGAATTANWNSSSETSMRDSKNSLNSEKVHLNELKVASACTRKITQVDVSLLNKQGPRQKLSDFSNLSKLENSSTMDLCNNGSRKDCIASRQSLAKACSTLTCSENAYMTYEGETCQSHSRSVPSPSIFPESLPGLISDKNTHAHSHVAQSTNLVDTNALLSRKSPVQHLEEFCALKTWKEASDSSTFNDDSKPDSLLVNSTSGMPGASALDLLAATYGDMLDSDDENDVTITTANSPVCGLPDVTSACDNPPEISITEDAPLFGISDSKYHILQGNPHLSSLKLIGKVKTEETPDVVMSEGLVLEDKPSSISTGLRDSSNIFMGKDEIIREEASLHTSEQSPKKGITCYTSVAEGGTQFHGEHNINDTQFYLVETGNQQQHHVLFPPVSEIGLDRYNKLDKSLKETIGSKASLSSQSDHRNIELQHISQKVSEDCKDPPGLIISSIGESQAMPASTEGSAIIPILEAGMLSKPLLRSIKVLDTGVGESGHDVCTTYSEEPSFCDHHTAIQAPLYNESYEIKGRDTGSMSVPVRNNGFPINTIVHSEAQTCNLVGDDMSSFAEACSFQANIHDTPNGSTNTASSWKPAKGFFRPRVFCLEHALEAEEQLQSLGGAHLLLLCHIDYPRIEKQARLLAGEINSDYLWKDIPFKNAAADDLEVIHSAIDDNEDAESESSDWTAQLGMSLHYSVKLSKSPLYSKQIPYNPVLDALFSGTSLGNYSGLDAHETLQDCDSKKQGKASKHKKITVAGKWCGRVWMVNQVHPYLRNCNVGRPVSSCNTRTIDSQLHWCARKCRVKDVEPSITIDSREQILTPIMAGTDKQPTVLSGNLSTLPLGSADIVHHEGHRKYKVHDANCKLMSEPSIKITPIEPISSCCTKNSQNFSITRSLGTKSKMPLEKVELLASTTLDTNVETITTSHPDDLLGATIVMDKNLDCCTHSKRKLDAEPTTLCLPVKKSKKRPDGHGDDVQAEFENNKEKTPPADVQNQYRIGTYGKRNDHVCLDSQETGENNFPLLHSCDTFQTGETESPADKEHDKTEYILSGDIDSTVALPGTEPSLCPPTQRKPIAKVRSKRNRIEDLAHPTENVPVKENTLISCEPSISVSKVPNSRNVGVSKAQAHSHSMPTTGEPEGGPSTRLRSRSLKSRIEVVSKDADKASLKSISKKISKRKKAAEKPVPSKNVEDENAYHCDIVGCTMTFPSKQEVLLHKRNTCTFKGCGKQFFSHKYLLLHRRVHFDDRPLSCPWKGCNMTFKWAWARTEHIRVHTGERPYVCTAPGCGRTFRFVSDFSRHKRKTGHLKQ